MAGLRRLVNLLDLLAAPPFVELNPIHWISLTWSPRWA